VISFANAFASADADSTNLIGRASEFAGEWQRKIGDLALLLSDVSTVPGEQAFRPIAKGHLRFGSHLSSFISGNARRFVKHDFDDRNR
jgi:hypothetical protein